MVPAESQIAPVMHDKRRDPLILGIKPYAVVRVAHSLPMAYRYPHDSQSCRVYSTVTVTAQMLRL